MLMPFPQYVRVKDNYCCLYLGDAAEYVVGLKLLKPQIEEQLPGLRFWIGCNDNFNYLFENHDEVVFSNEFDKTRFAYVREMRNDSTTHPLIKLMDESNLKIKPVCKIKEKKVGQCLICPEGISPTKSLKHLEVEELKEKAIKKGYSPIVLGSDIHHCLEIKNRPCGRDKNTYIEGSSWIIGVENEYVLMGAVKGVKTTLIKTGVGHSLFKQLSPETEVVESV